MEEIKEEIKKEKQKDRIRCTGHKIGLVTESPQIMIVEDRNFTGCNTLFTITEDDLYHVRYCYGYNKDRQIAAFYCPKCRAETDVYVHSYLDLKKKPEFKSASISRDDEQVKNGIFDSFLWSLDGISCRIFKW